MTFRYVQGWESVRNSADMNVQGWVTPVTGNRPFGIPNNKIAGSWALRPETFNTAAADISPIFAATAANQYNTGVTINSLWTSGGFVFGAQAQFRNTGAIYTIGDVAIQPTGTPLLNQTPMNRIQYDGAKYWSLQTDTATNLITVVTSTDLINWVATTTQPATTPQTISFVNSRMVVSHALGALSSTTDGGTTWVAVTIDAAANNNQPVSNVVYANAKYWAATYRTGTAITATYTSTDFVTWTSIDTYTAGDSSNAFVHVNLFYDGVRARVFQLLANNATSTASYARLRSFDFTNTATINYTLNGLSQIGPSSMATDGTGTGVLVIGMTNGTALYATGANPTVWTTAVTGMPAVTNSAKQCVAFDPRISKFVMHGASGYIAQSTDATAASWVAVQSNYTTRYNVGTVYLNGTIIATGQSVLTNDGGLGNNIQYFTETAVASNASTTGQGSSRLGFASISSSARSAYVGLMPTTAINTGASTAAIAVSINNTTSGADAGSETYTVSTTNPYHYYEFLAVATSTVNQFSIQILVDGTIVSSAPFTVSLAGTSDTTSTLYLTFPIRNAGVSALPTWVSFDELYLLDYSGTVNNTIMRGIVILADRPAADTQAQWDKTPSTAASNAAAVRANSNSTALGYVSSQSLGTKDIYTTTGGLDLSAYSVKAVTVEAVLTNTTLVGSSAKVGIISGAAASDTGTVSIATGVTAYANKIIETNPNTSTNWTRSAAQAASITLEKVS